MRNYLGGLLGAQTSRIGPFTDPGAVTRYVPNVGMLSLGEAAVEAVDRVIPGDWGASPTQSRLTYTNPLAGDNFGVSTAISGDGSTYVVGASGAGKQIAYVFVDGTQVAELTASDNATTDSFGDSVAISNDGSTIAVGATTWDGSLTNSGAIYIYEKPAGGWVDATEDTRCNPTDAAYTNNYFGEGVTLSSDGSLVLASEQYKNAVGTGFGAVQLYERPGAFGTWSNTSFITTFVRFTASDAQAADQFGDGFGISGDGNTIAIGAWGEDTGGGNSGKVYVFEKPTGGWATATEDHVISGSNPAAGRQFGSDCALNEDGTLLAIGSKLEIFDSTAEGGVHVYSFNGTSWTLEATLRGPDANAGDAVGGHVAMTPDGKYIAASARLYDDVRSNQGCIYVWEKPSGGWVNSSSPYRLTDANVSADNRTLGYSSTATRVLGISNLGHKILTGTKLEDTGGMALVFDNGTVTSTKDLPMLPWGGITGRDVFSLVSADVDGSPTDTADMTTTGILGLSDHYTALNRAELIP